MERLVIRRFIALGLLLLVLVIGVACGESDPIGPPVFASYPPMRIDPDRPYSVIFTTHMGRMTFTLLPAEAPLAVNSFTFLVMEGFFDGVAFHRLVPGVLVESGDPTGTGAGGPGYTFEIEPPHRAYARGDLVMANDGSPNSNGSRFFILLSDVTDDQLPPTYTLLGHLKADHAPSEATLDKIGSIAVASGPSGEVSVPQENIAILTAKTTEGCRATKIAWTQGC